MRESGSSITINTTLRRLYYYSGSSLVNSYPVAVGKPSTPTPAGDYKIISKIMNPGGVLGTRWMGLSIPDGNYGIHGTNNTASIGNAVSLGCIRMYNHDVEALFPRVTTGTPVHITRGTAQHQPGVSTPGGNLQPGMPPLNGNTYIVQPGDTLWKIAQKYNVTVEDLIKANQLSNPDLIYPGERIIIPGKAS